jgi:chromosome condensin MukBEF complex kleisin-like MukF subunit
MSEQPAETDEELKDGDLSDVLRMCADAYDQNMAMIAAQRHVGFKP